MLINFRISLLFIKRKDFFFLSWILALYADLHFFITVNNFNLGYLFKHSSYNLLWSFIALLLEEVKLTCSIALMLNCLDDVPI